MEKTAADKDRKYKDSESWGSAECQASEQG